MDLPVHDPQSLPPNTIGILLVALAPRLCGLVARLAYGEFGLRAGDACMRRHGMNDNGARTDQDLRADRNIPEDDGACADQDSITDFG